MKFRASLDCSRRVYDPALRARDEDGWVLVQTANIENFRLILSAEPGRRPGEQSKDARSEIPCAL
jgi:hypothetical protein